MVGAAQTPTLCYRFSRFELQLQDRRLLGDGVVLPLRPLTFDVLVALVERAGSLVTKDELLLRVWGRVVVEENTVQAHVSALRKVLGADAIETVSGQGYRWKLDVQARAQADAAGRGAPPKRHNLPQALTSFIGREREIAEVRDALASARLLTLTGAGGCGKTRLAMQVAAAVLDRYPDGVMLVELARLADPTLIEQVLAKALDVEPPPGKELVDALVDWLGARRVLLVLDNAEHLIEASARLADRLLRRCVGLTVLATSRERLGIDGELTYRVPSLSVPGVDDDDVLASEAARLFVDRVRLLQPDFRLRPSDEVALASICRGLDGIALAIELAAPKLQTMSLQALNARIEDRFQVLTGGPRTALPRHRTLRALIDWSHELLDDAEKTVLRRASIFAGGWTLAAAERVCGSDGVNEQDILGLLTALIDKSLVQVQVDGDETRFGMLETVRQYAQERLRDRGEETPVRERQLAHLSEMAAGLDAPDGASVLRAVARLGVEHDNLRAALAWSAGEPERAVLGLRLAGLLGPYCEMRAIYDEVTTWATKLLSAAPAGAHPDLRAIVMGVHAGCQIANGDPARALAYAQQAVAQWRQLADRRWLGRSLTVLGEIQQHRGELAEAGRHYEEALALAREIGDPRDIVTALSGFANLALQSRDYAGVQRWMDEALEPSRTVAPWVTALLHLIRNGMLRDRGDFASAREAARASVECFRECGQRNGVAVALLGLSRNSLDLGDLAGAWVQWRESFDWQPGGCDHWVEWLDTGASLAAGAGHTLDAARLWGCVQVHREQRGLLWRAPGQMRHQEAARRALGDDAAFGGALAEGRSWTLDEGVRRARTIDERSTPAPSP